MVTRRRSPILLQAATDAGDFCGIKRKTLLLCHFNRDDTEVGDPRATAKGFAAWTYTSLQLGLITCSDLPQFKAGDTLRVHFQVIEGERRRVQIFEGIVIKRQGAGVRETFTVRKQSFGVGVERTFPVHSPKIEKIEVQAIGDVNRAKLYYLRGKVGKKARVREKQQHEKLSSAGAAAPSPAPENGPEAPSV